MHWISLTLLCAMSIALADAVTKRWLTGWSGRDLTVVRFGLTGMITLPLLIISPPAWPQPALWGWLAWLIPLELLALVLYMRAIRDHALSLTLPYLAFTPAFVAATGWIILGEQVSPWGLAGIALVVTGSWWLHLDDWSWNGFRNALYAPLVHPGSRLMMIVAFIYALTSVGGKGAMQYMPAEQFGPLYIVLVGMGALMLFRGDRRLPAILRAHPLAVTIVSVLMGIMIVTHFLALQQVETAYMIAVKRTSLLFGIALGALWFGEVGIPRKLMAGAMMLFGVIIITLAQQ